MSARPPARRRRLLFLALGSNLGDRRKALRTAAAELGRLPGLSVLASSRYHETAPVPSSCGGPFLNAALRCVSDLPAMGLLIELKRVEARLGRRPGPRRCPLPIDIDIVSYGGRFRGRWLTLPHPRAAKRPFVLAPLAEVASPRELRKAVPGIGEIC
ncbi:MAG: 2-amino-4-hydroxy-6-hydroxymethyldihydropteridine diphosphokinase [Elusimicrobia bacterium]|nr:2-amino-4-hydroxy-6-hydroxymethyldihydropteridine diphosphokinase [Elusimicrobiota bacterium]